MQVTVEFDDLYLTTTPEGWSYSTNDGVPVELLVTIDATDHVHWHIEKIENVTPGWIHPRPVDEATPHTQKIFEELQGLLLDETRNWLQRDAKCNARMQREVENFCPATVERLPSPVRI